MIPRHMLYALGKWVVIKYYVDANNEGIMANRRSNSGTIIYINKASIICYSKFQSKVEA